MQKRGRVSVELILRKLYRGCFQIVCFAVETLTKALYSNISCRNKFCASSWLNTEIKNQQILS